MTDLLELPSALLDLWLFLVLAWPFWAVTVVGASVGAFWLGWWARGRAQRDRTEPAGREPQIGPPGPDETLRIVIPPPVRQLRAAQRLREGDRS